MLTPSIGFWTTPFTLRGSGSPAASRTVGATSMTWWNCERISPFARIRLGQWTIIPFRVPPKLEATCFVQVNGASPATAQPADMCGYDSGPPSSSKCFRMSGTVSSTPFAQVISLNIPFMPPSALVPLSPRM